jgi:hypothetical protein
MAAARLVPAAGDTTPAPTPSLPHYPCAAVTDGPNDAVPMFVGGVPNNPAIPEQPALDIRAINLRLTATELQVFMAVTGNPTTATMQPYESAWRYQVQFKVGTIAFTYGIERNNTADPGKDVGPGDAGQYPKMTMTGLGVISGSTAKFVPGTGTDPSWAVFTSPRSVIEGRMGPIDPGTAFTTISGATADYLLSQSGTADTTTATGADAQYLAGDDSCFGTSTTLNALTVSPAEFNHVSTMSATLLDSDSKPVAGRTITFAVQDGKGTKLHATTNANGLATASYPVRIKAGSYPVTATFAGDDAFKTSSATGTLKVSAEKTVFAAPTVAKPSAATRVVTTTLRGDNNGAIAGVVVDWYVNGKKVASGKTSKTGKVSYAGAKPGQSVQARFAGSPGMLLASTSRTVKV